MLVVISDLHLTDGTTCANIGPDAFVLLTDRLRDMAFRASWRADGRYRPIERIDLLLLGDIFDLLHSTRWAEGTPGPRNPIRPWDDPRSLDFTTTLEAIVDGILTQNAASLALLKKLTSDQTVTIPLKAGPPRTGTRGKRLAVPVYLHYLIGNHDWYLHLPGAVYDAIRQKVVEAIGLATPSRLFPYQLEELAALEQVCRSHGVYARHGDYFDPINYDRTRGRDAATLGDAIAVQLIDRFPAAVDAAMGNELPPGFIRNLREIVNVRPALLVPAWIEGLLRRDCQPVQSQRVKDIWNGLVDQFLREPFVRSFDKKFSLDAVDALEAILIFSKRTSLEFLSNLAAFITQKFWGGNLSFSKNAFQEQAFSEQTARYFVYGHTHLQEVVPLNVYQLGGQRVSQFYFNTGTWHVLHSAARFDPQALQFVGYNLMTYTAFYQGDERRGKPFETWSGTLAWE